MNQIKATIVFPKQAFRIHLLIQCLEPTDNYVQGEACLTLSSDITAYAISIIALYFLSQIATSSLSSPKSEHVCGVPPSVNMKCVVLVVL